MPQFDYSLWKWRALYRRRLFFFCVLQAVLTLNWLTARRICHHTQSWNKSSHSTSGYRKFYEDLPILFYMSHSLLLAIVMFTRMGRSIVHESQGKRLCDWSAFSLILVLIYHLVPLDTIEQHELSQSRDLCFSTLSLMGIALFQHLGVAEPILSITNLSVMILWIIFLCCVKLTITTIMAVAIVVLALGILSRTQESEFIRTFDKQKDVLQGGSYVGTEIDADATELLQAGVGGLGGLGFGSSLSVFLDDAVVALKAMESAIALQEEFLNRDDLLMECDFKVSNTEKSGDTEQDDPLYPVSASSVVGKEQEVVTWKLTSHAASLQVNKMLCQSLYQAVAHGEEHMRMAGSFSFNKICLQLFTLFESVCGNALTLYANETVSEVLISAPKSTFELIIFLLLHDCVNAEDRRICFLSCETSFAHGWHISLQSLSMERHRENRFASQVAGSEASTAVSGSSGEGLRKVKNGNARGALSMESLDIGRSLLLNENVTKRNRPMERIAERLALKYLRSPVQHLEPEYRAGVRVEQKIIPLSSDRCMLAPTHDSLTFARSAQAAPPRPLPAERDALLNSVEDFDGTASHAPQRHNHGQGRADGASQDSQQWLFVVQRSHDLEGMGEIKEKLKALCVPCRVKALSELRDPANASASLPFSVMLIDETFLSKLLKDKDKSKFKFLKGLPLKWVVVSDPKKLSSSTDIKVLYGIDGDSLSAKSSMAEVFDAVQMVTQKLPPRTCPDVLAAFEDHDDMDGHRLRLQSSNSFPSFGMPFRRGARGIDRAEVEAIKRWLLLVRQFKAVASKLPAVDSVMLNGLDARMKDIESLRDVHDNLEGLLAVPAYAGPLADMNGHKRKAKYILDTYQPLIERLKAKLEVFNLGGIQAIAAKCAVQSSTLGLLHLSAWFTTLQEIVSITINISDIRESGRGGESAADKSVSFSFTSAGKALAARSTPAETAPPVRAPTLYAGSSTPQAGSRETKGDGMALEDISEQEQSFVDDGDKLGDLPRTGINFGAKGSTKAGGGGAYAVPAATRSASAVEPAAEAGAGTAGQAGKAVDPGLRAIISDMVHAIEVAVWDAAMER